MSKIYFFRHQKAGVLWELPFSSPPTDAQSEAVAKVCLLAHGSHHSKTEEPYWLRVAAVEVNGPDFIPALPERSLSVVSESAVSEVSVEATGAVTNKKER